MNLTPAQPGTTVTIYTDQGSAEYPVQAWDQDGEAMIAAFGQSRLIQAGKLGRVELGFSQPLAAVLPGGGWTRTIACDGIGCLSVAHTHTEPVLAWMIQADGSGNPVFADTDGEVSTCDRGNVTCDMAAFTPPGGWDVVTTTEKADQA